jgi:hypothetical protein
MPKRPQPEGKHPEAGTSRPHRAKQSNGELVRKKPGRKKTEGTAKANKVMSLAALAEGMPGLTAAAGQRLAEAAAVCLEDRKHQTGVRLPRAGMMLDDFFMEWLSVDEQTRRCYADMQEATEWGACGVAILVVREVTGLVVIERSIKGTGFDYWLGEKDYDGLPFVGTPRLEISGILLGTMAQVDARIKQKKGQMKPTDHLAAGFVAVVEFGTPIARVESK